MSLGPGTRLGSYEIVSSLGQGGMGAVYRARDLKLGREVAIKVLAPELASDSEKLRRFEQEARAASALSHPKPPVPVDIPVRRAVRDVRVELRRAFADDLYQLDSEGKVRTLSESRLRRRLRQSRYSGLEMARREGDEVWVPLQETRIFREEVPERRDPVSWAAKRKVAKFAEHLAVYLTFGLVFFFANGEVPFWMGFWAIGLVAQAVGALPAAISLLRSRKSLGEGSKSEAQADLLSEGFRDEVERVRGLLERRGGENRADLLREIDGIVERMRDLASKRRDLEKQTGVEERQRLEKIEREAATRLEGAAGARERNLYEKQLDVVRQRRQTIDKALAVLEQLRVRQDVAEHQVKQLRLDLSRAEASSGSVPELSSRLQDIRHEVDAAEKVDEALA
jgi:hypothetical protein